MREFICYVWASVDDFGSGLCRLQLEEVSLFGVRCGITKINWIFC